MQIVLLFAKCMALDLVFFEIEIATMYEFSNFLKGVTIFLNRSSHRLVQKKRKKDWKGKKRIIKVWPKNLKFIP